MFYFSAILELGTPYAKTWFSFVSCLFAFVAVCDWLVNNYYRVTLTSVSFAMTPIYPNGRECSEVALSSKSHNTQYKRSATTTKEKLKDNPRRADLRAAGAISIQSGTRIVQGRHIWRECRENETTIRVLGREGPVIRHQTATARG